MGRETLYRCDVCGQVTRPLDCGRERILVMVIAPHRVADTTGDDHPELRRWMAVVEQATADVHRRALADDREPAADYEVDRIVCRQCWPGRPAVVVQVGPQGIGGMAAAQEVSP